MWPYKPTCTSAFEEELVLWVRADFVPTRDSCDREPDVRPTTRVSKMAVGVSENFLFVCISLVFVLICRQVESTKIRGVAVTSKFD